MVVHALKHYRDRLKHLVDNDQTIQLGNDILKKDLEHDIAEADGVAQLGSHGYPSDKWSFLRGQPYLSQH